VEAGGMQITSWPKPADETKLLRGAAECIRRLWPVWFYFPYPGPKARMKIIAADTPITILWQANGPGRRAAEFCSLSIESCENPQNSYELWKTPICLML